MFRNKRFFLYLSKAEAMKKKKREKSPLIQLGTLQATGFDEDVTNFVSCLI